MDPLLHNPLTHVIAILKKSHILNYREQQNREGKAALPNRRTLPSELAPQLPSHYMMFLTQKIIHIIEGQGDNSIKIYFETEENKHIYEDIAVEHPGDDFETNLSNPV